MSPMRWSAELGRSVKKLMRRRGMVRVRTQTLLDAITPQNRLLIGEPLELPDNPSD